MGRAFARPLILPWTWIPTYQSSGICVSLLNSGHDCKTSCSSQDHGIWNGRRHDLVNFEYLSRKNGWVDGFGDAHGEGSK